jgi:hypothetical protein
LSKLLQCPDILLKKRLFWYKSRIWPVSLFLVVCMILLAPGAAFADQTATGQQDFLTTMIWTIAALSIAEMIRNSIQGIFARLSGLNEASIAQKTIGAMAGMGAIFGLANAIRATASGQGGCGSHTLSGAGSSGIKLSGENYPCGCGDGGASFVSPGGEEKSSELGTSDLAAVLKMPEGHTAGLEKAADLGNKWGNALGAYSRRATATVAEGALGVAGMAVPMGSRLVQAGTMAVDSTIGSAAEYAGSAVGRFVGVQGSMLGQSWEARKQAQKLTGSKVSAAEGFRITAGGSTMQDALSRSLKFGGAYALHEKAGQSVLRGMKRDPAASMPTTGKMDSTVDYNGV